MELKSLSDALSLLLSSGVQCSLSKSLNPISSGPPNELLTSGIGATFETSSSADSLSPPDDTPSLAGSLV
tara:strand:+ start:178 stop:387 length:210 start_codon:yes stop_codon:yes gene_type:complete